MPSPFGFDRRVAVVLSLIVAFGSAGTTAAGSRTLTFEMRVAAQEAIERVRYAHQVGDLRPFDEAVPRAVLEGKVRTYLEQSAALEKLWHTPITAEMLRGERERMTARSRMPDRLTELFRALGDDPLLIQECLARQTLADRLARSFFAFDRGIHEASRVRAETLRSDLVDGKREVEGDFPRAGIVDVFRVADGPTEREPSAASRQSDRAPGDVRKLTLRPEEFDRLRAAAPRSVGEVGSLGEEREAFVVRVLLHEESEHFRLATYAVPKQSWDAWWNTARAALDGAAEELSVVADDEAPSTSSFLGGTRPAAGSARERSASLDPAPCFPDNTWNDGALEEVPDARLDHTAIWTGSVMVVWGGHNGEIPFDSGGRYDPATDSWAPVARMNAPEARVGHSAVWTGSSMIVWGGFAPRSNRFLDTGARYDPLADAWTPVTMTGAPAARSDAAAVWSGSSMTVWGGTNGTILNSGGRYDPVADAWVPVSSVNAPSPRFGHRAVFTGTKMVVWGGTDESYSCVNSGGRYDPVSDVWTATSTTNAPAGRCGHSAVWTGSAMVVWGGYDDASYFRTGGRYDPVADSWSATSTTNAPLARASQTAIWTGSRMLIWGGYDDASYFNTGGRYDPVANSWSASSLAGNAPYSRAGHTAVWTGSLMLVWGGEGDFSKLDDGARYNPATDSWTPMAGTSGPTKRILHTAVWTGNEMIVWGGDLLDSGGRYDPATDHWTPTSTTNAPAGRRQHTAVWVGDLMLVWGGNNGFADLNTGGRYDPLTDSWTATSTGDAPTGRSEFAAVWTGKQLIVWGGVAMPNLYPQTGGLYDPRTDRWTAMSTAGAPAGRTRFTAVWTGDSMIVWGGATPLGDTNSGGRYDPDTDTWTATSTLGAPIPREWHVAAWLENTMVVWGGFNGSLGPVDSYIRTGGRYSPSSDEWDTMTTLTNAPVGRYGHTAVPAGDVMIVWGGTGGSGPTGTRTYLDTGARYSPSKNEWHATTTAAAPSPRSFHSAVWTGNDMIVWGGLSGSRLASGGILSFGYASDLDRDDVSRCQGDCNDADPSIYPGAFEVCNALDDNCDGFVDNGAGPPAATPGLRFASAANLTWSPASGGRAYDIVKGDLGLLRSSDGKFESSLLGCLHDDLAALSREDAESPDAGEGYYYVVRAIGCGQNGTYDSGGASQRDPRDADIAASPMACPP